MPAVILIVIQGVILRVIPAVIQGVILRAILAVIQLQSTTTAVTMKLTLALCALAGILTYAEAIFLIGAGGAAAGTTISAATASQGFALAGIGGLVLGAGLVGVLALASRRGKRSVDEAMKEDSVFNLVSSADVQGCALKLVCLLEAKEEKELNDDDNFILGIFGRDPQAPSIEKMKSARGAYDYAAFMGHKFGLEACDALFYTCDYSYKQMIAYVGQLRA